MQLYAKFHGCLSSLVAWLYTVPAAQPLQRLFSSSNLLTAIHTAYGFLFLNPHKNDLLPSS